MAGGLWVCSNWHCVVTSIINHNNVVLTKVYSGTNFCFSALSFPFLQKRGETHLLCHTDAQICCAWNYSNMLLEILKHAIANNSTLFSHVECVAVNSPFLS